MTSNSSEEVLGPSSKHFFQLEDEQLREARHFKWNEAPYQPSRTPSDAVGGAHDTQTVPRTVVLQPLNSSEELNRDSFLRFRDEWVRNNAQEIQRAGSVVFNTCSEDTASITALNEFYRSRVFDGFTAEHRKEKGLETGTLKGSGEREGVNTDLPATERLRMCRIDCREKGRRVLNTTCRRRANSLI